MSFPSALLRLNAGDTPKAALLFAMQHDTPLGYRSFAAVVEAVKVGTDDPLDFVKTALPEAEETVLGAERRGDGVWVDFDPLSDLARQGVRLMTDAARPLLIGALGMPLGIANCHKVLASPTAADVRFTTEEQIEWQNNIHC